MIDGLRSIPRKAKSLDDNLIPLINVVFLMLIFFLIAGQITASEPVGFQLPESTENLTAEDSVSEVVVYVLGVGEYQLNGESLGESALSAKLEGMVSGPETNTVLTLKADALLQADKLQDALLVIKKSGIKSVELLVERVSHAD